MIAEFDFKAYLGKAKEQVEAALDGSLGPERPESLREAMRYSLLAGGKRLRPILCLGILVGLGFYLPFSIVLTYTLGTVARIVCDRVKGLSFSENVGIPFAAGLIVGEALVGVGTAVYHIVNATG